MLATAEEAVEREIVAMTTVIGDSKCHRLLNEYLDITRPSIINHVAVKHDTQLQDLPCSVDRDV